MKQVVGPQSTVIFAVAKIRGNKTGIFKGQLKIHIMHAN